METLFLSVALLGTGAEPAPQFTVTNRCVQEPKFTVENKTAYDPYGVSYEKLREHVLRGHRGILTVGGTDRHVGTYQTHAHVPSGFHGIADGEYECYLENGKAMMRPVASAQGVAPVKSKSEAKPGGCGCTASRNCGAAFCKSKGGTGCPQSCPVK